VTKAILLNKPCSNLYLQPTSTKVGGGQKLSFCDWQGNSLITSEVWFTDHCANLPFNIAYAKACVITCCCRYVTRCFMGRSCLIAAVWAGDFLWTGDGCTGGSCMGEVPISLYIAASTTNIEQTNWVPLLYKWKMVTLIPNPAPSYITFTHVQSALY